MKPESDAARPDTLAALILRSARQWPDAESVLISGCRWTFDALVKRSIQVAGALRASGLKRGDRIGLMPEDSPEYLELCRFCSTRSRAALIFRCCSAP
jgi:acyl-CoA synthetase (AMP-forming)/AMP-acid ligase II